MFPPTTAAQVSPDAVQKSTPVPLAQHGSLRPPHAVNRPLQPPSLLQAPSVPWQLVPGATQKSPRQQPSAPGVPHVPWAQQGPPSRVPQATKLPFKQTVSAVLPAVPDGTHSPVADA